MDHLIIFILFSSGTFSQKIQALFLILNNLDPGIQKYGLKDSNFVFLLSVKDLAHRAIEHLGVPVPYTQVSDTIEKAVLGYCPSIVKGSLSMVEKISRKEIKVDVTSLLVELSSINHAVAGTRNVFFSTENLLFFLFEYYLGFQTMNSVFISIKLIVEVKTARRETRTKEFFIDPDLFGDYLKSYQEEAEGNNPRIKLRQRLDSGGMSNCFEDLGKVLNIELDQIQVDDINTKISFKQFHDSLLSIPVLSWALCASPPSIEPNHSKDHFPKEIILEARLSTGEPVYRCRLLSFLGKEKSDYLIIDTQRAFDLIAKNEMKFKAPQVVPFEFQWPIYINPHSPISFVLDQIDYLFGVRSVQMKEFSQFIPSIFNFSSGLKASHQVIIQLSNGEKRRLDTGISFSETFLLFNELIHGEKAKIETWFL